MSNQSNDGFQGSQPFIIDNNLTEKDLKLILEYKKQNLKKNIMSFLENKN